MLDGWDSERGNEGTGGERDSGVAVVLQTDRHALQTADKQKKTVTTAAGDVEEKENGGKKGEEESGKRNRERESERESLFSCSFLFAALPPLPLARRYVANARRLNTSGPHNANPSLPGCLRYRAAMEEEEEEKRGQEREDSEER